MNRLIDDHMQWLSSSMENIRSIEQDMQITSEDASAGNRQQRRHNMDDEIAWGQLHSWAMDPMEPYSIHAWIQDIHAVQEYAVSSDLSVAVLDSGISRSAIQLFSRMVKGYDFISNPAISMDGDGRDSDFTEPLIEGDATGTDITGPKCGNSWHGTMTSTLLAANFNSDVISQAKSQNTTYRKYSGILPGIQLMQVRVLGECGIGYASDVADAIIWAAGGEIRGLDIRPSIAPNIIVLPFSGYAGGSPFCPSYLQSAVDFATARNITLIASAGNNYGQDASYYLPANCTGVFSADALDRQGRMAPYSNKNAFFYFPGGTFLGNNDSLTCITHGKVAVACGGTSFAAMYTVLYTVYGMQFSGTLQYTMQE
jgi:hypothetical protein